MSELVDPISISLELVVTFRSANVISSRIVVPFKKSFCLGTSTPVVSASCSLSASTKLSNGSATRIVFFPNFTENGTGSDIYIEWEGRACLVKAPHCCFIYCEEQSV